MTPGNDLGHYAIRFVIFVAVTAMWFGGSYLCDLRQEHLRRENNARRLQEFDEALQRTGATQQAKK